MFSVRAPQRAMLRFAPMVLCAMVLMGHPVAALDHFACSEFKNHDRDSGKRVALRIRDQFGIINAEIGQINYLCAPAEKTHKGKVTKPKSLRGAHLACYKLMKISPSRKVGNLVRLTNQFEVKGLPGNVKHRMFICIPSGKLIRTDKGWPGFKDFDYEKEIKKVEASLNHFLCSYFDPDETKFKRKRMPVTMKDQFRTGRGRIRAPTIICAPAIKTLREKEKMPKGGLQGKHLACYELRPKLKHGKRHFVAVVNQLSKLKMHGTPVQWAMYCIPTDKVNVW